MEGNVNITLEELDSLRSDNKYLKDKVEELEGIIEGLKDKSRVFVTRYDKVMPSHTKDKIVDIIVNIIEDSQRVSAVNPYSLEFGESPYGSRDKNLHTQVNAKVMQLVRAYFDSRGRNDISQQDTKFVNFDDVKEQVMKLYELEVVKELNERRELIASEHQELEEQIEKNKKLEAEWNKKLRDVEKERKSIEFELKEEYGDVHRENELLKDDARHNEETIKQREQEIKYQKTQKEKAEANIESLNETIDFQKKRMDKIKQTWWYKMFADKREFEN